MKKNIPEVYLIREQMLIALFAIPVMVITMSFTTLYHRMKSYEASSIMFLKGYVECIDDYKEQGGH